MHSIPLAHSRLTLAWKVRQRPIPGKSPIEKKKPIEACVFLKKDIKPRRRGKDTLSGYCFAKFPTIDHNVLRIDPGVIHPEDPPCRGCPAILSLPHSLSGGVILPQPVCSAYWPWGFRLGLPCRNPRPMLLSASARLDMAW